jgi:hypothetical protein
MLRSLITKLAVGPSHDYGGPSLADLKKEGITAVIDLNQDSKEMNEASKTGLTYVTDSRLRMLDNSEPIPIDTLKYVAMKIHQLISQGHYVYLHCSASCGRSPTIAAAYLICLGKEKNEAMNLVRGVRSGAWSGKDRRFAAFLDEFEKAYRGNCVSE